VLRSAAAAPGGSLEASVEAAVAVAADHLHGGDRVTLVDLGRPRAGVPPGTGRRHLDRIRFRLAQVSVDKLGVWRPGTLAAAVSGTLARLPPGAPVVVVSPFYDPETAEFTLALARAGRRVVALDTAPPRVVPDPRVPRAAESLAVVALERAARLARLHDAGVVLHRWEGRLPAGFRDPRAVSRQPTSARRLRTAR
jgi:hypothetical protein